jgi:hypothetical protein
MSLLTGLLYSWMSQLKKPIALKTAIFHFILIVAGLILSINAYGLIVVFILVGAPDTTAFAVDQHVMIAYLAGPALLILGAFVFLYGIISALSKKAGTVRNN